MSARTVDDVLREYSTTHNEGGSGQFTTYDMNAMAARILDIETRLATLDAERAGVNKVVEAARAFVLLNGPADFMCRSEGIALRNALRAPTPTTPEASDGE